MNNFYNELNRLINDILEQKISQKEVYQKIRGLKESYGEDVFPEFAFVPEEKPWNKDYMAKLKKMSITGACSEQFILHIAEVSEYLYKRRKVKYICVSVAGIIVIMIIAFCMMFRK